MLTARAHRLSRVVANANEAASVAALEANLPRVDGATRLWLHFVNEDDRAVRVVLPGPARFVEAFAQIAEATA